LFFLERNSTLKALGARANSLGKDAWLNLVIHANDLSIFPSICELNQEQSDKNCRYFTLVSPDFLIYSPWRRVLVVSRWTTLSGQAIQVYLKLYQ